MNIKLLPSIIILMFLMPALCPAQDQDEKILMNVAERNIQAAEFIRMFKKTPDPENRNDLDNYLQQYIVFMQKVVDAIALGYDTTTAFRTELNGYRSQLAQSYLTDPETKENLLKKAYQRSLVEVNAWHILVNCPPDAPPEDTLKAWNKAMDIRERIREGEPFEQVSRGASDDQSVMINGGNLGYFTVFQMIMPFEDAAYSLKKGEISMPVRTPYGYHIIKVTDRRPSKGKVRVAHIMKASPPGTGEEEAKKAEEAINNIYEELQEGASFRTLAEEYSDHKESANRGGELNWFGTGEIISDFSETALALEDTGDYSKPVRTMYGWHIIKLLEKKAPGSFDESRSFLESKINQSYLNSISKKSFIAKLKKEYEFRLNRSIYEWFVDNTDTLKIRGLSKYNQARLPSGNLYLFADQHLTSREFADYLERRGSRINTADPQVYIDQSIEARAADHIISYENSILEKKYPEFRYLMNEFHDGILLFEISSDKIWNKAQEDSTGLMNFYEAHKHEYMSHKSIEGKIYTLRLPGSERKFKSTVKKCLRKSDADKRLYDKYNMDGDTLIIISEGRWFEGDDKVIDRLQWTKGLHSLERNDYPSLLFISKVNPPAPLPLNEIRGEIVAGYQEYLENEWIRQLKEKYPVRIDTAILDEVRRSLTYE